MISDEAGMLGNFNGRYSNNIPNLDLILKSYNCEMYSGLIAQLIYCFLKSNIGQRKYDTQPMPKNIAENYQHLIYRLLHKKFTYRDENDIYLYFEGKAFREFVDYYNNFIEKNLLTEMAFCKDWGSKYHCLILRICGIIHCVRCELDNKNHAKVHVSLVSAEPFIRYKSTFAIAG